MEQTGSICEQRDSISNIHTNINSNFKNNNYIFYNINDNYNFHIENKDELLSRINSFFNNIKKNFKENDKILIVGHGTWLFEFTRLLTGQGTYFNNCDIKIFDFYI